MEHPDLFDGWDPPAAAGMPTSVAAAEALAHANRLRAAVLGLIRHRGPDGATCDEAELALGMRHQTASARVWELRRAGLIRDSGRTRKTRSGRAAVVWVLNGGTS